MKVYIALAENDFVLGAATSIERAKQLCQDDWKQLGYSSNKLKWRVGVVKRIMYVSIQSGYYIIEVELST